MSLKHRIRQGDARSALLTGARALESRVADVLGRVSGRVAGPGVASPLEVIDQACDEVARQVHPAGRGRYAFPFNDVCLTFVAPTAEDQARFDAICAGPPTLHERVLRRLASAGCESPDVDVRASFVTAPDPAWTNSGFNIALSRLDWASRTPRAPALRLELIVTHGAADRGSYAFTTLPIAIGRGAEVRDHRQQLIRINHVAFAEGGDEVTQSVSRRHARIELDETTGRPRLIDDNSAQGTSVIRNGRGMAVPRGSRGLGLQSGDEIGIGQARLKVTLGP